MKLSRRDALAGLGGLGIGVATAAMLPGRASLGAARYTLTAAPGNWALRGTDQPQSAILNFDGAFPGPILRARQGEPLEVTVLNKLAEPTTVHWHGLRLPNAMDGVPYLTQAPIEPGKSFTYRFAPPDAGTFWYHPHSNSLEQVARGLAGMLIVEEAAPAGFDAELALVLKDWVVAKDGSIGPLTSTRAAGRTGTFGNIRSINGAPKPYAADLPAGGIIRLRILAADVTRVYRLEIEGDGAEARVLATDGNPLEKPWTLEQHALGPGMRVDIGLRLPEKPGMTLRLVDYSAGTAFPLALFSTKAAQMTPSRAWPVLAVNPIPMADLATAELLPFEFSAGQGQGASICAPGQKEWILWSINKRAVQEDASLEPPLFTLQAGRSYIAEFVNRTPHTHPIHLHGHTFRILDSNQDDAPPPHWADTALLRPEERIRVAFVAAPGRWMLHCHILEHQISGMMGYITVA